MNPPRMAGAALLWLAAVTSPADAGSSATVRLAVVDEAGRPLAARVSLAALQGRLAVEREIDGAGRGLFVLPAGAYRLVVAGHGRAEARAELRVDEGETSALRAVLAAAGDSRLEVEDRGRLDYGATFDAGRIELLPSSGTVWSLLETTEAGAISDRMEGPGLYPGEPARIGMHGSSWTQASFAMGGLDVTDPVTTGTPLLLPDLGAFESYRLTSALASVEQGAPGPSLSLRVRRPAADWRGSVRGAWSAEGLQADPLTAPPAVAHLGSVGDLGVVASGPLARDRAGLLVAGRLDRARRREGAEPATLRSDAASLLAHALLTPGPSDEIGLTAAAQDAHAPLRGRGLTGDPEAGERHRALQLLASWQHLGSATWRVDGGYQRVEREPEAEGPVEGSLERLLDGPVPANLPFRSTRERWDARLSWAPGRGALGGRHALRLGAEVGGARAGVRVAAPLGPIGEHVAGLPARAWDVVTPGESRWRSTDLALSAADRMALPGRLDLEAGLRLERTNASARDGGSLTWTTLMPRVAARWRPTRGSLAFLAGWGRYRHRLPLEVMAVGDPAAPSAEVFRWRDVDRDRLVDEGERGPLVSRVGPGGDVASIADDLRAPRTEEVLAGIEARLGEHVELRFVGLRRRERDLLETVNVGVPSSAYDVRLLPDPSGDLLGPQDDQLLPVHDRRPASFGRDRYVLSNPDDHDPLYEGVTLTAEARLGSVRLGLGGSAYRASGYGSNRGFRADENDQGLPGEQFDQPNAVTFGRGRLFSDRAYTLKIWGLWEAPAGFRLGAVARYQDGQPFSRLVVVPDLRQGADAVQAIPNGRFRFTFTATLDARVEKHFGRGRRRVALVLEGFNLTGLANEVEEDVVSGPGLREPTLLQPPRAFRLGLRLDL